MSIIMMVIMMIAMVTITIAVSKQRDAHAAQVESLRYLISALESQNQQLQSRVQRLQVDSLRQSISADPPTAEEMAYVMQSLGAQAQAPAPRDGEKSEILDQILADLEALSTMEDEDAGL